MKREVFEDVIFNQKNGDVMDINAYVLKDGKLQLFRISITSPEPVNDKECTDESEFYCIVTIPTIFTKQKFIYGLDESGALENAYTFIKALMQGLQLVNERGEPIDVPWSHIELGEKLDNLERHNIGVVACLISNDDGTLRLVFDDVKSDSDKFPQQWKSESLFTWVDMDIDKARGHELTDKLYEEIGFNLVARLVSSIKTRHSA